MAVQLIYKDIAVGAAEDAEVTTSTAEDFSEIVNVPFDTETGAVATGELNGWGLIHDYMVRDKQPFAFWSKERSGGDCVFTNPPTITLTFSAQYTTTGLTLRFSPGAMDYCTQVSVTWYQGEEIKESGTYYPDGPEYVVARTVEAFDKITFVFEKTNLPGKRLKVEQIIVGVIRKFGGDELKSASFVHEVDLISDTVPVNVLDAACRTRDKVDFVFQRKQPVEGYNDGALIGVYYIEKGRRTGARDFEIACCDAIGVLDIDEYGGGIWFEDTPLVDILAAVFGDIFEFDIDPAFAESTLRGHITPGTKREALQQIAFALGAVVDTTGTYKIRLYPPPVGTGKTIPATRTYTGGEVEVADKVTEVEVTAYTILDERPGEDQEYIEFNDVQYRCEIETKHAVNPDVVASDLQNKIKFTDAYLVNLSNAQTLADNILAYYMRRETYSFKHVLDGQEPGARAAAFLPWGGETGGNIIKMSLSVTGIAVSDTEMLLDG